MIGLFQLQNLAFHFNNFGGQTRDFRLQSLFLFGRAETQIANALVHTEQDYEHQRQVGDHGEVRKQVKNIRLP